MAAALLGKLILRRLEGEILAARVVETEAYFSADDPAAHAFAGRTARTEVLFGPPGHAYVYFVYGMHHCLNVSCEPEGQAGCVLIRALQPEAGAATMARLRGLAAEAPSRLLTSGPGRVCQALAITRAGLNGVDMTDGASPLHFLKDAYQVPAVSVSGRIGIRKAVALPARFYLAGHPCVSGRQDPVIDQAGSTHKRGHRT